MSKSTLYFILFSILFCLPVIFLVCFEIATKGYLIGNGGLVFDQYVFICCMGFPFWAMFLLLSPLGKKVFMEEEEQ